MPELPEVQTVVNDLCKSGIIGKKIKSVEVYWRRTVDNVSSRIINARLVGQIITSIERKGKYILFNLKNGSLFIVHLRMSGRLKYTAASIPHQKHEHVILPLSMQHDLRFYDPRKFGRIYLDDCARLKLQRLGIDPMDASFSREKFDQLILNCNRQIKSLLLDQSRICGIGNIYADECLWRARLHPLKNTSMFAKKDCGGLYRSIRTVLRDAIDCGGTSLGGGSSNFASATANRGRYQSRICVYGRTGSPCPRCRTNINRITVMQRSTHYCPRCQAEDL
jgi:formamidopyrimidine-DNA glycosylase